MLKATSAVCSLCLFRKQRNRRCAFSATEQLSYSIYAEFVSETELKLSRTGNLSSHGKLTWSASAEGPGYSVPNFLVNFSVQIGREIGHRELRCTFLLTAIFPRCNNVTSSDLLIRTV